MWNSMLNALAESITELRNRVSNVRYAEMSANAEYEEILFDLDGNPWKGSLKGRNRDALLGFNKDADRALAVRTILDGDAAELTTG